MFNARDAVRGTLVRVSDHAGPFALAPVRVAFRGEKRVGAQGHLLFRWAQWLACALPCRRFAAAREGGDARLGADVDRYSFIVMDFHHLLLFRSPGALSHKVGRRLR